MGDHSNPRPAISGWIFRHFGKLAIVKWPGLFRGSLLCRWGPVFRRLGVTNAKLCLLHYWEAMLAFTQYSWWHHYSLSRRPLLYSAVCLPWPQTYSETPIAICTSAVASPNWQPAYDMPTPHSAQCCFGSSSHSAVRSLSSPSRGCFTGRWLAGAGPGRHRSSPDVARGSTLLILLKDGWLSALNILLGLFVALLEFLTL